MAGYKGSSDNHSILEEAIRGSESVDAYKKDNGRVYLPPVGKEAQSKDIMNIYGPKERKKPQNNNISRISGAENDKTYDNSDADTSNIRKIPERKKVRSIEKEEDDITDRDRSVKQKESERRIPPSNIGGGRVAYKVHDLNQDVVFDKNIDNIKNVYGGKSNAKINGIDASIIGKDPIHLMIKKHKNQQLLARSPSQE